MLERKNKSAIINLSSQSIQCPYKDLTVYTATKAYNDLFSRCLNEDYPCINVLKQKRQILFQVGPALSQQPEPIKSRTVLLARRGSARGGHSRLWGNAKLLQDIGRILFSQRSRVCLEKARRGGLEISNWRRQQPRNNSDRHLNRKKYIIFAIESFHYRQ